MLDLICADPSQKARVSKQLLHFAAQSKSKTAIWGDLGGWPAINAVGRFMVPTGSDPALAARNLLDELLAAIEHKDKSQHFSNKPEVTIIGSGETQYWYDYVKSGSRFYGCGAQVLVDKDQVVTSAHVRFSTDPVPAQKLDQDRADKTVRTMLANEHGVEGALPKPYVAVIDKDDPIGGRKASMSAYVYAFPNAEQPHEVIVDGSTGAIVETVLNGPNGTLFDRGAVPKFLVNPATGAPSFVTFEPAGLLLPEASGGPAAAALAFFSRYPAMFGTGQPSRQLRVTAVSTDSGAPFSTHVDLQQVFDGVDVLGCVLRVHLLPSLAIRSISGNYQRDVRLSSRRNVSERDAEGRVGHFIRSVVLEGRAVGKNVVSRSLGLIIVPARLPDASLEWPSLAWRIHSTDADRFVDADTGAVVLTLSNILAARNVSDGSSPTFPLLLEDGVAKTTQTIHPDAFVADGSMVEIERLWRVNFDRSKHMYCTVNAVDDPGTPRNEATGAFFHPLPGYSVVSLGTGHAIPTLVAHEFGHEVIYDTSKLLAVGESQAIDEHFGDMHACFMFPGTPPGDWGVGLNAPGNTTGFPIRNLRAPDTRSYGDTSTTKHPHDNSGPLSLAFVRVVDGYHDPARSIRVAGMGRRRAWLLHWRMATTRLHPFARFIDVLANSWQVCRELAGAEGVTDAPADTSPQRAISLSDVQDVLSAFRSVDMSFSLLSGWYRVSGAAVQQLVAYEGETLADPNEFVERVRITAGRRRGTYAGDAFVIEAKDPGNHASTDSSGTVVLAILSHGVGTSSKEIRGTIAANDFVEMEWNPYCHIGRRDPGLPSIDGPPFWTPVVAHWFDFPFFGRKYGDVIYEGVDLPAGNSVVKVKLELFGRLQPGGPIIRVSETEFGHPPALHSASFAGAVPECGAWIKSIGSNPQSLEVRVRSWHNFGWAVRYRLIYTIQGTISELPEFTLREVVPFDQV